MFIASPRSRFIFCQFGKRFAIRNQVRKSLIIAVLQVPGTTWHSVSGPKARSFWLIPIHTRSAGRFRLLCALLADVTVRERPRQKESLRERSFFT